MAKENDKVLTIEELQAQLNGLQKENEELKAALLDKQGPAAQVAVVKAKDGLNLRCGPCKTYDSLAILPKDAEVSVLELPGNVDVPGWALVVNDGTIGWVMTEYIEAK